jgi:hypothetical protein
VVWVVPEHWPLMLQISVVTYMISVMVEFLKNFLVARLSSPPMLGKDNQIMLLSVQIRLVHAIEIFANAIKQLLIVLQTIDPHMILVFMISTKMAVTRNP